MGRTKNNSNLGKNQITGAEAGAKTAQPAWVNFMGLALKDVPAQRKDIPEDIVRVRIDRDTGLLTNKSDSSSMFEYFVKGTEPTEYIRERFNENIYSSSGEAEEELF